MEKSNSIFLFLDTKQMGNMFFGDPKETPMITELYIRNDSDVKIESFQIDVKAHSMIDDSVVFSKTLICPTIKQNESVIIPIDFSKIIIYGVFEVKFCGNNVCYETRLCRLHLANRRVKDLAINTHVAANSSDLQDDAIYLMKKIGCTWILDDLLWNQCERKKGEFIIPEQHKRFVEKAKENGFKIRFNTDARDIKTFYGDCYFPVSDETIAVYANYMSTIAKEFKGNVDGYEICSEWDHRAKGRRLEHIATPKAYAKLLTASYKAVKKEDPDALVVLAGTCRKNIRFVEGVLKATDGKYTDALVIHPYPYHLFQVSPCYVCVQTWENLRDWYIEYRDLANKYCPGIPIWNTESGWSSNDGVDGCTEILQAAYSLQHYITSKTVPELEMVTYYDFSNDGVDKENYEHNLGLVGIRKKVEENSTPYLAKPAFAALSVISSELNNLSFKKEIYISQILSVFQFVRYDGKYITSVWTLENALGKLVFDDDLLSESDYVFDMFGNSIKAEKTDGKIRLSVCDYPVMICSEKPIELFEFNSIDNLKDFTSNEYSAMEMMI